MTDRPPADAPDLAGPDDPGPAEPARPAPSDPTVADPAAPPSPAEPGGTPEPPASADPPGVSEPPADLPEPGAEASAPATGASAARAPQAGHQGAVGPQTVERFGRPVRHFAVAISSEAMALAWANQENAPHGATVIVDHEINPRGLHGRLWDTPQPDTLACSVVLRPPVSVEEADVSWLVAGLAGMEAAEATANRAMATWWPDEIVDAESKDPVGAIRAEIQLGPGQVKAAVITVRLDLVRLELDPENDKDAVLEAMVAAVDRLSKALEEGAAGVAGAYEERCAIVGKRVKVRLRPKGETRGVAHHVDRAGRLEVQSMSGMIERVGVNQLMELTVV